ncbi:NYN domain-containing protein [Bradyrhizobium diazoefficiens]|uniref:NYN domain-containing protein n=1 Tax=Bradyrhizobium diazoefficiens TaxID=1355477 RepID=UPI001909BC2D|nr:NYN domain-containing protein [Bradyrhizobium diazoefficiens]MBK3662688.1 NYN domain-containing protein [Bradyrhizobium diazoefficiens]
MQTSLQINTAPAYKAELSALNDTHCRTAIVIDTDSLLHRGIDKKTGRARPQRSFNYFALAAALRERRVCDGSFCRNRDFPARAVHMIRAIGLKPIAVRENVDRVAMLEAIEYAFAGFERVILVTHDGDYLNVMRAIQACGIAVEVWGLRQGASKKLTQAADRVVWIDYLMLPPSDLPGRIGPFGVIRELSLSQAA